MWDNSQTTVRSLLRVELNHECAARIQYNNSNVLLKVFSLPRKVIWLCLGAMHDNACDGRFEALYLAPKWL